MKQLLISVLTSGKLELLRESVASVKNQLGTKIKYTIHINVNSLDEDYYEVVKNEFPTLTVFKTESNGKPGKGHNSNLKHFEKQKKFDLFLPLDGDDFLYPYTLKRLEYYLEYNPDILILPYNDMLNDKYPENCLSSVLDERCYFNFNNFVDDMRENWIKQKKNPLKHNINATNTGGRLFLISKRGLKANLKYTETLGIYDDTVPFLTALEYNNLHNDLNIFILEDVDMYLYNKINTSSVSHTFDPIKETKPEEENFRKEVKHKFLSIRDYNLNQFKFLKTDAIPEFNALDKYNFARKVARNIGLEQKSNKNYDNYKLFISHAVKNKNADMLRIYVKQFLIYTTVYNDHDLENLKLYLLSYTLFTDCNDAITLAVFTSDKYKSDIDNLLQLLHLKSLVISNKCDSLLDYYSSIFNVFSLDNINLFNKVLYLDNKTIFNSKLLEFMDSIIDNKIYCLEDKNKTKYDHLSFENKENKFYNNKFMLFNNTKSISDMFGFVKLSLVKYLLDNKVKEPTIELLNEILQFTLQKNKLIDDVLTIDKKNTISLKKNRMSLLNIHDDNSEVFTTLKNNLIEKAKEITNLDEEFNDNKFVLKDRFLDIDKDNLLYINDLVYLYKKTTLLKFSFSKNMFINIELDNLNITNGAKFVPINKNLLVINNNNLSDNNKNKLKSQFVDYNYHEFNNAKIDDFINLCKAEEDCKALCENYEKMNILSVKHLIFVVLFLYKNGGVYINNTCTPTDELLHILEEHSLIFTKSIKIGDGLNDIFFACGNNHELFKYYVKLLSEISEAKLITNQNIIEEQLMRLINITKTPNATILDIKVSDEKEEESDEKEHRSTKLPYCEYVHNDISLLKYYFVTEVLPDKDKNVYIGPSDEDVKTITLETPIKVGNNPLNKQHPMWDTTFEVEINELELTVRKSEDCVTENNPGWKQHLVLPVLD